MKRIVLIIMLMCTGLGYGWCMVNMDNSNTQGKHVKHKPSKAEKEKMAQVKKVLDQARTNIKKGNGLENSEKQLRELLKDTAILRTMPIHEMLCQVIAKQYEIGNEKLFLKEKYDTAALFNIAQRMFLAYNNLDSIDNAHNLRSGGTLKYRKANAALLSPFHKNLYSGGVFYLNHQKYKEAWSIIDTYLSAIDWPLFSSEKLVKDSLVIQHASYISLISAYQTNDYGKALKYMDAALAFRLKREVAMEYVSDIYMMLNDMTQYENYLRKGVEEYPESSYFFPHLIDYYSNEGMSEKAMTLIDGLVQKDSTNLLFMKVKQVLLLNKGNYDECIRLGNRIISLSDSIPDVYYNVALAIYNQALIIEENSSMKLREKKKQMNALYKKCLPYMEKFRAMKPEEKDKWRPILYTVYLNLNMGKEFDEILKMK